MLLCSPFALLCDRGYIILKPHYDHVVLQLYGVYDACEYLSDYL